MNKDDWCIILCRLSFLEFKFWLKNNDQCWILTRINDWHHKLWKKDDVFFVASNFIATGMSSS